MNFCGYFLIGLFFYATLNEKAHFLKIVFFAIVNTLAIILIRLYLPNILVVLFGWVITVVSCFLILKFKFLKSIIAVILSQIATFLGELIALLIENQLNIKINANDIHFILIHQLLFLFIFTFIIIIIYYFRIKMDLSENINRKKFIGLIINAFITLFLIAPNFIFFFSLNQKISSSIILFNIIAFFIFFFLSIYNTNKGAELESKTSELEYQKLYNRTLTDLLDSLRGFRHDYSNTIYAIEGYLIQNDLEGLKQYFLQLKEEYTSINNLSFVNSIIINNPPIYGLLASKFYLGQSKGIKFNIEITSDLENCRLKTYQLCRILGILIDNAIEASEKSPQKHMQIVIKYLPTENEYIIKIENSFSGDINIQEIFKKGVSSKGDNRGLGLWEVKNITEKYKYVNLKTKINEKIFIQELTIESNKN